MQGTLPREYKKVMESYGWFGEKEEFLKIVRFQTLRHTCKLKEYLSPTKKGRISRTDGKKAHNLAFELMDDSELML